MLDTGQFNCRYTQNYTINPDRLRQDTPVGPRKMGNESIPTKRK